jgi:hypothetical protein
MSRIPCLISGSGTESPGDNNRYQRCSYTLLRTGISLNFQTSGKSRLNNHARDVTVDDLNIAIWVQFER